MFARLLTSQNWVCLYPKVVQWISNNMPIHIAYHKTYYFIMPPDNLNICHQIYYPSLFFYRQIFIPYINPVYVDTDCTHQTDNEWGKLEELYQSVCWEVIMFT